MWGYPRAESNGLASEQGHFYSVEGAPWGWVATLASRLHVLGSGPEREAMVQ